MKLTLWLSAGMWTFHFSEVSDGTAMPVTLVIDVSTAIDASQLSRLSGGAQRRQDRRACWNVLDAIREHSTPIAFSDDVHSEWDRKLEQPVTPESYLAILWLKMLPSSQIVRLKGNTRNASLRNQVSRYCSTLNDVELLEAAAPFGGYIVSADKRACRRFRPYTTRIAELAGISWIIPACPHRGAAAWISSGAPATSRFLLSPQHRCGR